MIQIPCEEIFGHPKGIGWNTYLQGIWKTRVGLPLYKYFYRFMVAYLWVHFVLEEKKEKVNLFVHVHDVHHTSTYIVLILPS